MQLRPTSAVACRRQPVHSRGARSRARASGSSRRHHATGSVMTVGRSVTRQRAPCQIRRIGRPSASLQTAAGSRAGTRSAGGGVVGGKGVVGGNGVGAGAGTAASFIGSCAPARATDGITRTYVRVPTVRLAHATRQEASV